MKRCEDCKWYKDREYGPYCNNKNRKEHTWTSIAACSSYVRKWWKFWRA